MTLTGLQQYADLCCTVYIINVYVKQNQWYHNFQVSSADTWILKRLAGCCIAHTLYLAGGEGIKMNVFFYAKTFHILQILFQH